MKSREDAELSSAKRAYKEAEAVGNCQEEARWANVVGDILKNRGEYVEALKWLRIDYEVSMKHLPEKQLLPTCQSLGEVYLRLQDYQNALKYQKEHLQLARDSDDLVEQQRAATQLGRTYHELFIHSEDDHGAIRNAKKHFKSSKDLAEFLNKTTSSYTSSPFLKELIDAHNNLGMLEMDVDNLEGAKKLLEDGLKLCDQEEVIENDHGRSRLNHNLGNVYLEMRMWDKAREHIERDIRICNIIEHRQGEAKGYINLGELHYRGQNYDQASDCYQKAMKIAKSMKDEDALVETINQNINTINEARKVMDELKKEEQNLKKLTRETTRARGTPRERKCLLQQNASLDILIEKCSMIFAWVKHLNYGMRKKEVAEELCDKEKMGDSYLVIGESYQKLRNFHKADEWYQRSLNTYKSIGNLEGQGLAKINIGCVLDSLGISAPEQEAFKEGYRQPALEAFEEGYRIAVEANMPSVQISALENMHYSYMIRHDNVDEARRVQLKIRELKSSTAIEPDTQDFLREGCSETETEGDGELSDTRYGECDSPKISDSASTRSKFCEVLEDDEPLIELVRSKKKCSRTKFSQLEKPRNIIKKASASRKELEKSNSSQFPLVGRKRRRVVLLDDDSDGDDQSEITRAKFHKDPIDDVATSNNSKSTSGLMDLPNMFQDDKHFVASKNVPIAHREPSLEVSACSQRSGSLNKGEEGGASQRSLSAEVGTATNFAASGSKEVDYVSNNHFQNNNSASFNLHNSDDTHHITCKIDDKRIRIDARSSMFGDMLSVECMKVEVASLYYLQHTEEKKSKGLLPVIGHMKCGGKALGSMELFETLKDKVWENECIEVTIDGWVQKSLMKLYLEHCMKLHEAPEMSLLKKLYNLEVSEDEVIVSGCKLQDTSIAPLLEALREHKTIAMLDLSHNFLGVDTMLKIKEIFISSSQTYGGLTLDLHSNRLGPTALLQICECPVLFKRLEVLNISANRLTDACGSYLETILLNCKGLYSLNIERCSITSITVQKIADSIDSGSDLAQLCLGHNNPISGNAMVNLLAKLLTLRRFSELNLNGIKLSTSAVNKLCELAKTSCLSGLMLGGTSIGSEGALNLTKALSSGPQELVRLDLSYCRLLSHAFEPLCADIASLCGLLELNLGGNPIGVEGVTPLVSLLSNPQCCLRVLILNKCRLGLTGIIKIIQALSENESLEELNLAENIVKDEEITSHSCDSNLEVADSEEEEEEPMLECRRTSTTTTRHFQELSKWIGMAQELQLLDLSKNGFTEEIIESLYTSWSSSLRSGILAQRHVEKELVHFCVDGKNCCGFQICCKN